MEALASRRRGASWLARRVLAQAGCELLLAQASDWPFILKRATTVEYARRRVMQHLDRFDRLARQLEDGRLNEAEVRSMEAQDDLFPELDPGPWSAL